MLVSGLCPCVMKFRRSLQVDLSLSFVFPFHNAEVVRTKNLDSALWKEKYLKSAFRIKEKSLSLFVYIAPDGGMRVFCQSEKRNRANLSLILSKSTYPNLFIA